MQFGERKLTQLCRQELGREPKINELFLFFNMTSPAAITFRPLAIRKVIYSP
jgi:hypothetical protein